MHIQYQTVTLEGVKKTADIMFGIYDMEFGENTPFKRWVWTSDVFGGILSNIDEINFRFKCPIDNVLTVNNKTKFFLKQDILVNLKLTTTNFTELNMRLESRFNNDVDPRDFGIQVFGISIGSTDLF